LPDPERLESSKTKLVLEDLFMAKTFDPFACIPCAHAVRKRLAEIEEEARRLGILLKTAEEIEREEIRNAEIPHEVDDASE
jgi:hypothetical protein